VEVAAGVVTVAVVTVAVGDQPLRERWRSSWEWE